MRPREGGYPMSYMRTSGWKLLSSSQSGLAQPSSTPTPAAFSGHNWRTTWSAPWKTRTSSTRTSPWETSPLWTPSSVTARGWSLVIQWRQWRLIYQQNLLESWLMLAIFLEHCVWWSPSSEGRKSWSWEIPHVWGSGVRRGSGRHLPCTPVLQGEIIWCILLLYCCPKWRSWRFFIWTEGFIRTLYLDLTVWQSGLYSNLPYKSHLIDFRTRLGRRLMTKRI